MKILTSILTCSKTQKRANACLETWVKDIKPPHEYYFYGDSLQSKTMDKTWNSTPDEGELRGRLPEKTYKMLIESLKHEWDFLFKCDDDSFVVFHKLIDLLKNYNPSDNLYIGNKIVNPFPYAQGGAGYALTRSAVEKCIFSLKYFYGDDPKNKRAEDYSIGLALKEQGIDLTHTDLFSTPARDWVKKDDSWLIDAIIKNNKITTHYVRPDCMKEIYKQLNSITT